MSGTTPVELHMARVSEAASAELLDPAPLDPDERARLLRLRRPADATRFTMAHVLLRRVVGQAIGCAPREVVWRRRCRRCGGPHGRPFPVVAAGEPAPSVSLSSAGELAVVALCRGAVVGVDVESVDAVAAHSLVGVEQGQRLPDDPVQLARWWVRREAVLKATGDGLVVPASDLVVEDGSPPRLTGWRGRDVPTSELADLEPAPGYVGAVAVLGDRPVTVTVVGAVGAAASR